MALEDVIKQAIDDARDDGLEGAQKGDEIEPVEEVVEEETSTEETTTEENTEEVVEETEETTETTEKTDEEKAEEAAASEEAAKKDKKGEKADLMKELGLKPRADGRLHRIPINRVEEMVTKAREGAASTVKTVVEGVGKALGLPETELATATWETLSPKVTEVLGEASELRERVSVMDELAPIMMSDGDLFIKMLAGSNPEQYKKFLAVLEEGFEPTQREAIPDEKNDPKPLPDVDITLPDGTKGKTYSQDQHEKLLEWQERKSERKFNAALEKRFKPLDDKDKAAKTKEAKQQQILTEMNDYLSYAHKWKGFEENKAAILETMKTIDKKVPFREAVRQAYEQVYLDGKVHLNRTKMREEILAELKKAPTTTAASKKGGSAGRKHEEATVRNEHGEKVEGSEAAIRRSLAKARSMGVLK